MDEEQIREIIEVLEEMCEESSVPRNIRAKFQEMITCLRSSEEMSVKVNKALHDLDEIGDDMNLQPYIRTQIWNIVSMLEKAD
jgi:uncharacterized protein (UPF0147 family)